MQRDDTPYPADVAMKTAVQIADSAGANRVGPRGTRPAPGTSMDGGLPQTAGPAILQPL